MEPQISLFRKQNCPEIQSRYGKGHIPLVWEKESVLLRLVIALHKSLPTSITTIVYCKLALWKAVALPVEKWQEHKHKPTPILVWKKNKESDVIFFGGGGGPFQQSQ